MGLQVTLTELTLGSPGPEHPVRASAATKSTGATRARGALLAPCPQLVESATIAVTPALIALAARLLGWLAALYDHL